jgi:hypothetical protein
MMGAVSMEVPAKRSEQSIYRTAASDTLSFSIAGKWLRTEARPAQSGLAKAASSAERNG